MAKTSSMMRRGRSVPGVLIMLILGLAVSVCSLYSDFAAADFQEGVDRFLRGEYEQAIANWAPLANQGEAQAQYALGVLYTEGTGSYNDPAKALHWFQKAADQGHLESMFNVGNAYWSGRVVSMDREKAVDLWRRAARGGLHLAQYNLGSAYFNGTGVKKDIRFAVFWFQKAADSGDPQARNFLTKLRKTYPQYFSESDASQQKSGKTTSQTPIRARSAGSSETADEIKPGEDDYQVAGSTLLLSAKAGGTVLATLERGRRVKVLHVDGGWAIVRPTQGFDVWIYSKFTSRNNDRVVVKANQVRARALPSTAPYSHPVGVFFLGEKLQVLERHDDWLKVRGAKNLSGWIKFDQLRPN